MAPPPWCRWGGLTSNEAPWVLIRDRPPDPDYHIDLLQGPSNPAYHPCRLWRLLPSMIYLLPNLSLSLVLCLLDSHQGVFDPSNLLFFLLSLLCPPMVQLSL